MYFKSLWNELAKLPEVEALALGGSRAGSHYDEKSDYDLYVFCTEIPDEKTRKQILEEFCQYMEIGNSYWEFEDDCTLKDGTDIDVLYRNFNDFSQSIHLVVDDHNASNGYSTCFWHGLLNMKILYDREGKLEELQEKYRVSYPDELRKNIVNRNIRLLTGNLPSYDSQIRKALERNDLVSVNHRIAAFLESYFDIIFALNKMTHPGEKRMVQYALEQAKLLPNNFEENLNQLFDSMFHDPDKTIRTIENMIEELVKVLELDSEECVNQSLL